MIQMQHLKITFEDIMQTKLLYYDDDVQDACFDICDYFEMRTYLKISKMSGFGRNGQKMGVLN